MPFARCGTTVRIADRSGRTRIALLILFWKCEVPSLSAPRLRGKATQNIGGAWGCFPGDPIVEQEYQKRFQLHGINIRPDLIVHIPFDRGTARTRADRDFVAVELKRRATKKGACSDFESLELIKNRLGYPLTVFVNIDSAETYAEICPPSIAKQTVCFAVRLKDGNPVVTKQLPADIA